MNLIDITKLNSQLRYTIDYYGVNNQLRKLQEEIDEFKKEVYLYENGIGNIVNIIDEYADVVNVLTQFKLHYKIDDKKLIPRRIYKSNRTYERTSEGYYDKKNS